MNILKIFRSSGITISLALFLLLFSCSQYELQNRKFDYSMYEAFKTISNSSYEKNNSHIFMRVTDLQDAKDILSEINLEYNTDIQIPNYVLENMITLKDKKDVESFLIQESILKAKEIELITQFINDCDLYSFDIALDHYENNVIALNPDSLEFERFNLIGNSFKIMNENNSSLFDNTVVAEDCMICCIFNYVLWVIAVVATFVSCMGPQAALFCWAAIIGLIERTIAVAEECAGYM